MKTFIFVFVGEFGYELLNWHGTIRKFIKNTKKECPDCRFISCSRLGMNGFYELCDQYIDISELDTFKNSIANGYTAEGIDNGILIDYILNILKINKEEAKIFISSKTESYNGLIFGRRKDHEIYKTLDLNNNEYIKISPNLTKKKEIEEELSINLDNPFILVQSAARNRANKDNKKLPIEEIVNCVNKDIPLVLLGFNTNRKLDSISEFNMKNIVCYRAKSFIEQGCLIHYAKKCLFLTEGDFRSHIYVPPLMGKDVHAVAWDSIFALHTAPVDFWNENVFKFGGKIIPIKITNEIINKKLLKETINGVLGV